MNKLNLNFIFIIWIESSSAPCNCESKYIKSKCNHLDIQHETPIHDGHFNPKIRSLEPMVPILWPSSTKKLGL